MPVAVSQNRILIEVSCNGQSIKLIWLVTDGHPYTKKRNFDCLSYRHKVNSNLWLYQRLISGRSKVFSQAFLSTHNPRILCNPWTRKYHDLTWCPSWASAFPWPCCTPPWPWPSTPRPRSWTASASSSWACWRRPSPPGGRRWCGGRSYRWCSTGSGQAGPELESGACFTPL